VQPPLRPELKSSGFDQVVQVVIHGRAEKPIYFFINEGEVEVMDAEAI
jgi:aldehyde:ferredoxin oxidoreductase